MVPINGKNVSLKNDSRLFWNSTPSKREYQTNDSDQKFGSVNKSIFFYVTK